MPFFDYPEEMRGRLIAAARQLLKMNHDELAKAVGISRMALTGLETEKGTSRQATEMKVVSYLEARGIEFVDGTVRIGVFLNLKDAGADERPPGAE